MSFYPVLYNQSSFKINGGNVSAYLYEYGLSVMLS